MADEPVRHQPPVWTPSKYNDTIRKLLDLLGRAVLDISEDAAVAWGNLIILNENLQGIIPGAKIEVVGGKEIKILIPPELLT